MLNPKFLAASMVAFGLAGGPSIAQDTLRQDPDAQFVQLDTDRDGLLTKAEAARLPGVAERFDRFDRDKDGKITRSEFAALVASMK